MRGAGIHSCPQDEKFFWNPTKGGVQGRESTAVLYPTVFFAHSREVFKRRASLSSREVYMSCHRPFTFGLSDEEAKRAIAQTQEELGLPCTDAIRYGAEPLVDAILT